MSGLREARELLLIAHQDDDIDDEEFCLLYNINRSQNLDYPYWNYEPFQLDEMDDSECWSEFRFYQTDICRLKQVLRIPDVVRTYNWLAVNGVEALCIYLKRFSYPCRYSDMIPRFGRAVLDYSIISTKIMNHVYTNFSYLLNDFDLPFLQPRYLETHCQAIYDKGGAFQNCMGFIDGSV